MTAGSAAAGAGAGGSGAGAAAARSMTGRQRREVVRVRRVGRGRPGPFVTDRGLCSRSTRRGTRNSQYERSSASLLVGLAAVWIANVAVRSEEG